MHERCAGCDAFSFILSLAMAGCAMGDLPMKAPNASDSIEIPSGTSVESVFSCAETTVRELADADDRWDARVTRRDVAMGILETANYPEENESGFRIRLDFAQGNDRAQLQLKGAGAYFVDMGVEDAMRTLKAKRSTCISGQRST